MASKSTQQKLYEQLIGLGYTTHGKSPTGTVDKRWVCLTGPDNQKKWSSRSKVCFILYGPNLNYEGEKGAVQCLKEFWQDLFKELEKGAKFHQDVYDLFKRVHHLLEYGKCRSEIYPSTTQEDWIFFDVKNWSDFSRIVRLFNKI